MRQCWGGGTRQNLKPNPQLLAVIANAVLDESVVVYSSTGYAGP